MSLIQEDLGRPRMNRIEFSMLFQQNLESERTFILCTRIDATWLSLLTIVGGRSIRLMERTSSEKWRSRTMLDRS